MAATPPPQSPAYRWHLLRAGPLWLDGGSMFGVVPRVLWSKLTPPDDQGRIPLAHNCLLLQRIDPGPGPRTLIIEAGSGNKFDPKMRAIFGLSEYALHDAVREAGLSCDQIDAAIVSHLHFDHVGGLTRRALNGEKPDWTAPDGSTVKITFPNAPVYVQTREWEDATQNRSVMTRTYLQENLEPLRDHLKLIDSPQPFPPAQRLDKDQSPPTPLAARLTQILPGISVFLVPGHTWGQQAITFTDDQSRTIVFTPDIMPTIHHVGAAYNMAYDVEPYLSTITRRWFLQEAAQNNWLLIIDHEPNHPAQQVTPDTKGWFKLKPLTEH